MCCSGLCRVMKVNHECGLWMPCRCRKLYDQRRQDGCITQPHHIRDFRGVSRNWGALFGNSHNEDYNILGSKVTVIRSASQLAEVHEDS